MYRAARMDLACSRYLYFGIPVVSVLTWTSVSAWPLLSDGAAATVAFHAPRLRI